MGGRPVVCLALAGCVDVRPWLVEPQPALVWGSADGPRSFIGLVETKTERYWIFLNIAIAASLDAAREWHNLVSPYLDRIGQVFSLIVSDILYWCLPFALAVCLLTALRSEARGRRLQESPKGNHTNV